MEDSGILGRSSVRYLKNGRGGRWWANAKTRNQAHLGWSNVSGELLRVPNWQSIGAILHTKSGKPDTADINRLRQLLIEPDRHIWVTFETGFMWWCTLRPGAIVNPDRESDSAGHFWLDCDLPWSNESIAGRKLSIGELPGRVTSTAGFRSTVCTPIAAAEMLRIIGDRRDPDVVEAERARNAYVDACERTLRRLGPQDFELLVDLVLARSGWARTSTVGKTREGVDIEADNIALGERAFVQVKSAASQADLDEYVERFRSREGGFNRMIFAVHSPRGALIAPDEADVQLWTSTHFARLVVRLGLGEWLEGKIA